MDSTESSEKFISSLRSIDQIAKSLERLTSHIALANPLSAPSVPPLGLPKPLHLNERLHALRYPLDTIALLNDHYLNYVNSLQQRYEEQFSAAVKQLHQTSGVWGSSSSSVEGLRVALKHSYSCHLDAMTSQMLKTAAEKISKPQQPQPATLPSSDKKPRPKFNKDWLPIFEYIFSRCKFPTREDKIRLSEMTGMSYRQIGVWFQNRRSREGKDDNSETASVHVIGLASPKSEPFADPISAPGPVARPSKRPHGSYGSVDAPVLTKDEGTDSSSEIEEESDHGEHNGILYGSPSITHFDLIRDFTPQVSSPSTFPAPYEAPSAPTQPQPFSFDDDSMWPRQLIPRPSAQSLPVSRDENEVLDLFGGMRLKTMKSKHTHSGAREKPKAEERSKAKEERRQEREERRRQKAERRERRREKKERKQAPAMVSGNDSADASQVQKSRKHAALPSRATPKPETSLTSTSPDESVISSISAVTPQLSSLPSPDEASSTPSTAEGGRSFSASSISTMPSLVSSRSASTSSNQRQSLFEFGRYPPSPADSGAGDFDSSSNSRQMFDHNSMFDFGVASDSRELLQTPVKFNPQMPFSFSPEFSHQPPILAIPPAHSVSMPSFASVLKADMEAVASPPNSGHHESTNYNFADMLSPHNTQPRADPDEQPSTSSTSTSPVPPAHGPLPDPLSFEMLEFFDSANSNAISSSALSHPLPTSEVWTATDQWTHPTHSPVHTTDIDLGTILGLPLLNTAT